MIFVKLNLTKADPQKQPNTSTPALLSWASMYGYNKDRVEDIVAGIGNAQIHYLVSETKSVQIHTL